LKVEAPLVVYTVHEPPSGPGDRLDRAEQLIFVKDGFHWIAALVPPLWLLAKRLWLELAIYLGATALVVWALTALGAETINGAFLIIVQIVFGFEAGAIYSAALQRRGWREVGTVAGRNSEDCERRYLEVWLPTYTQIPSAGADPATASPTPTWAEAAWTRTKEAVQRGRQYIGAKA
jgi:hypothetical protein